jgi:uncharacterized membrane protein YfcA
MADINIWVLAGTGFAAGLLGAMLGVGGGFIIVPILTTVMGLPIQFAIGSSLVSIVINACTATSVYIRKHMTNLKLGFLLSCTLVPGAVAGAFLAAKLSSPILTVIFGALMIYVAYLMMPKKHKKPALTMAPIHEKSHAPHAWLDGCYFDPAVDEEISYRVHRPVTGMVTGFFGGVISSLLGVGGGIINVPVMNQLMKVPVKATIATSSLLLCFTTMTGSLIYAFNGYVVPFIVAPLIISVYVGARLGAAFAHRARSNALMVIFTVFLLVMAAVMILKALNITW